MNIIYVSCACSKKKFAELFKGSNHMPGQQVQKYHRLIMEGLALNDAKVQSVTSPPITNKSFSGKFIKQSNDQENNVNYIYLPFINLPLIKNICIIVNSFYRTMRYLREYNDTVVICDVLNISVSAGALLAAKIFKRKIIGIVTDIPIILSDNKSSIIVKINSFIMNHFDSYIVLTDQMNQLINKHKVPHIVIEGHVDIRMSEIDNNINNKYSKKVCIYAGGLQKIYGIKYLIEAFIKANVSETELHIYGNGNYENELKSICDNHTNIQYYGVVENDIVVKEEIKATLLINPRPSNEEYTKYSFPSKNMEYMASGTPVLTTRLPGMPQEYYKHVYLIDEENVNGLSKKINEILNIRREELHQKGTEAKKFVLQEKNNVLQAKRIICFIKSLL